MLKEAKKLFVAFTAVIGVLSMGIIPTPQAAADGTRCTTSGETLFLRFNYVPVQGQGYLENKAIIYVPKEAQCSGSFPMYVHLHGDNKHTDDISPFYLPASVDGVPQLVHYADHGTVHEVRGNNSFQRAIETTMRNTRIPGMVFVLPVNASTPSNWVNLDGAALKTAVQNALNTNPKTQGKGINLSNDTILSGHSGAGCHPGQGLMGFPNLTPKAVGVLDTCPGYQGGRDRATGQDRPHVSVYQTVSTQYPSATTLLFYAATMAYSNARVVNNQEEGGYHNLLATMGFQQLTTCDAALFFRPHNPATAKAYGKGEGSPFRQYWDNPQLWCSKSPNHNWYGLFATNIDHSTAAALGMQTLLSLHYAANTPNQTTSTATNPAPAVGNTASTGTNANTVVNTVNAPLVGGTVPLEVSINGISSIDGGNSGYIINYTRILFVYAAGLTGALALLILIVAGLQLILTSGSEKNTQAIQLIIGSISGLALLATSGWILYLINPCFFSFSATSACTPRGNQPSDFTFVQSTLPQTINNPPLVLNGTPPPPPTPNCNAANVCDVVLRVPYISQIEAPDECSYDGVCATNRNAGDDGGNPKWGQVSCGAAAYSIAYLYVSGNSTQPRQFLSQFINDYFRCGIHGLREINPAASATINNYDAVSAPRLANDPLCAYELGGGGRPGVLVNVMRTQLGARGTHTVANLSGQELYRELSAGHPIVIGGVIRERGTGTFIPHAHYTVIIGIQGYNASTGEFTNLVIHDVGRQGNSPMTFANYTSLRSGGRLSSGIAVSM